MIVTLLQKKYLRSKSLLSQFNSGLGERGFTLLEVIIAMAIMVLAFSAILAVEQGSIHASTRAKQMNIVAMLAKNKMVETEFTFQGKKFEELKKEEAGQFDDPYQDYKWTTQIKEIKFPSLSALAGGGSKGASGGVSSSTAGGGDEGNDQITELLTKFITNFFSKAIRQVTVTVSWKRGKGEQTFSLSTYWVDLNYEFNFSE